MNVVARFTSWSPYILGITRILVGILFAAHGAQKIFGAFGGMPPGIEVPFWIQYIGGSIEFFGGALIAIGLFTRFAAFICSGMMAVAYFYGHARNGSIWPNVNMGELAVVYCWLFLYIAAAGAGAFALDNLFFRRAARTN
ncbi:MAG TPA: DoxX family protein [Thermoanaerobaculia bacterium]|nr:DoxX family protein [Thermoanaerobaculia bacterium]